MQGETTIPSGADYVVLARKYRSRTFGELIGQDALVRTLTNAIQANKIHHAYVLTGIRGTGKTSTARLLAMALNCENGPSVDWDVADTQVEAIRTGRHVDVFEFDAASNRSVEDIQRLFEGVNYAPVVGRYKVYIIDEVHMLSTTAFNALLKTLEEPPPRVKFIFATTEVNKIPVTVLSRCQRFDLKRIPSEVLAPYFTTILDKEGLSAEPAAVQLIARAADGSVRDGLSLLDQAIALSHGTAVKLSVVEEMLGVADRVRLYDVLEAILGGKVEGALALLDDLYAGGTDALGVVQGMLELVHLCTRIKIVKGLRDGRTLTELERTRAVPLADRTGLPNLGRVYQLLMQSLQDVKAAERPYEALSMAAVRMAYLAPLPAMDKLVSTAQTVVAAAPVQPAPQAVAPVAQPVAAPLAPPQPEPTSTTALPTSWKEIVTLIRADKPMLAASVERQVHCMAVEGTKLELAIESGLLTSADIIRDIRASLRSATGATWDVVEVERREGGQNLAALAKQEAQQRKDDAAADPLVAQVMGMFPGAELEYVEEHDV